MVEIYQGYRNSSEGKDVPRPVTEREAQRFGAGFVWNAWAKGLKLGVQSSSDHVSTHISYAAAYVAHVDRDAIMEALKARRTFAATDNFIMDVRMGDHFMGEAFRAAGGPLPLKAYVRGTGPLKGVAIIKNNRIVYSAPGGKSELKLEFNDTERLSGEAWYYIRAEQENGQLVWSSPIWVTSP